MVGIKSYGVHIPRYRLSRKVIFENMGWHEPATISVSKGEKSVANWDEDSLTMAVSAAFDCMVGEERKAIDAVYLASTSLPFTDRQNAGVVCQALNARENGVTAADFTGSLKAGTTAAIAAIEAIQAGKKNSVLVAASDQRCTKTGTMYEMFLGDGAAAFLFGNDDLVAEFKDYFSMSCDFIDHYRGSGKDIDYTWEERWVRDEGYSKVIPSAVHGFLEKTGLKVKDFDKVIYPCYFTSTHSAIAKAMEIDGSKVMNNMHDMCGDTGTAHPLLMFASALEEAKPGDRMLLVSFGQGCDVLWFEVTDRIEEVRRRNVVKKAFGTRSDMENYQKYCRWRDLIVADSGIRGETNHNTLLSVLWRNRNMVFGFLGGKCRICGTPQFPARRMCVKPDCGAVNQMEEYEFADKTGRVLAFTGDMLTTSLDPPAIYGLVDFEGGGRAPLDFTDCSLDQVTVGMPVRFSFRKRYKDNLRGFTGYFWKAVPA